MLTVATGAVMHVEIKIEASGGTFSEDVFPVGDELARILHGLANQVHGIEADSLDGMKQPLRDSDGVVVGTATFRQ